MKVCLYPTMAERFEYLAGRPDLDEVNFWSEAFQRLLEGLGVTCSMSRSGNCRDNAVLESFFSTMKVERCHRTHYATREAARANSFDYIERFSNPIRGRSILGKKSPINCERAAAA